MPSPPAGLEWRIIQTYQDLKGEESIINDKLKEKKKKETFRKSLDFHVNLLNNIKKNQKNEDQEYYEYITNDIEIYKNEENNKKYNNYIKNIEELNIRKLQINDKNEKILKEKEKLRLESINELNIIKEQTERENQKLLNIKLNEKNRQNNILNENKLNLNHLKHLKTIENETDYQLMKEYSNKLDKEAYLRDTAFAKRMEKLDKYALKYSDEGAGKKQHENDMKSEQLLLKEILKKENNDIINDNNKINNKKKREIETMIENNKILQRKYNEKINENN